MRESFTNGIEFGKMDSQAFKRIETIPLVSIVIPVIRPKNMPRLVKLINKHAGVPEKAYEILTAVDEERIGCPKMVKYMTDKSRGQMVMFLGDDILPWKGFLKHALKAMAELPDGWGLVGLNDQVHDGNALATHWLAHKNLLPLLGGEFFHTGYRHCFCDNELITRAKAMDRYVWAEKAKLKHRNPIIDDNIDLDADYERVYSKEYMDHDRSLFLLRRNNNWSTPKTENRVVAIGIPSYRFGEEKFRECLKKMQQYSSAHGIGTIQVKNRGSIVHHSRNKIVDMVRNDYPQAGHLMMIDDDMTFPEDTLIKMLSHNKEMIISNAYRKVYPYAPIAQVFNIKEDRFLTAHMPPDVGVLRRISTGGTGIALFDMEIFNKIPFPWFEFAYATDPDVENKNTIEGYALIGEDMNFFIKASDHNIPLYCDFSIDAGHILIERDKNGNETRKVINWKTHEEACQKQERQSEQECSAM